MAEPQDGVFEKLSAFQTEAASSEESSEAVREMRINRRAKTGTTQVSIHPDRTRDPMFYWRQNNWWWGEDITDPETMAEIRAYGRAVYMTHPIIGSVVDIFSRFPITGMSIKSPDPAIVEFYEGVFLDGLNYDEFLEDVGREYWTVGEANALGSWSEKLGIWEAEDLVDPDRLRVIDDLFSRTPKFEMQLPEAVTEILRKREPRWQYEQIITAYPELKAYPSTDDERSWLAIDEELIESIQFRAHSFSNRGIPILLRAFRTLVQEEMLNSAMDSIASRLYTPLVLARLGANASDLGTNRAWIPTPGDLQGFQDAVSTALMADFRMITHHFAVDMQPVFGRESMPRLDNDFERVTERLLQVFGMSKTMLSGASGGQTYAADAINRDLITQLMTKYQRRLKRLFHKRAMVVAKAQEHYDYELKGGKRIPIMEEVLERDPDGREVITQRNKLLVPTIEFKALTLKDEKEFRNFLDQLRATGVPISMGTRLRNVEIDLEEEVAETTKEQVDLAVQEQLTRKETYLALKAEGLPIQQDLIDDFEPTPTIGEEIAPTVPATGDEEGTAKMDGTAGETPNLTPPMPEPEPGLDDGEIVRSLPRNRSRPEESDEQREGMPRASVLIHREVS